MYRMLRNASEIQQQTQEQAHLQKLQKDISGGHALLITSLCVPRTTLKPLM